MFHQKKQNINHLRVFGCAAYPKIEKLQLRKLDDISKMLVNLGTEPGSKAYRLYDPQTRRIIVSRDVVFDEMRSWDWSRSSLDQKRDKNFGLTLGTYGNRGLHDINSEKSMSTRNDHDHRPVELKVIEEGQTRQLLRARTT